MAEEGEYGFDAMYSRFSEDVQAQVRRETFGEDLGQYSWTTREELEAIVKGLGLRPGGQLLDVACGAGGPARFVARRSGCRVVGVDSSEGAVATASRLAREAGLDERTSFQIADGGQRLPFADASFDALLCVDAIVLLPDRPAVLRDWARLLRPGARLAFTDPGVLTGLATLEELSLRTGRAGNFVFSIPGQNEQLLKEAGLTLVHVDDSTAAMEKVAAGWHASRSRHQVDLVKLEGDTDFEEQQRFFAGTRRLAAERRQSRFTYLAERP